MLEVLEDRCLLSAAVWPDWLVAQPAQAAAATLDAAQTLPLSAKPANASKLAGGAAGTVVNHAGTGGVDWYSFTLTTASDVHLSTLDLPGGTHLNSILSLYNTEALDPFYPFDFQSPPYNVLHHRLLAQVDGSGGPGATLDRQLAPGTYFVAVSGHGNQYFNPFLDGSGYAGSTGDFRLLVSANPLALAPTDGPTVLAVDPGLNSDSVLHASPLALYIDFSSAIDPSSVVLVQQPGDVANVELTYNPTGNFGIGDTSVILAGFHYASDATELQLKVAARLRPGFYKLTLVGTPGAVDPIERTDAVNGTTTFTNLGENSGSPAGQDFSTTFQIDGNEGDTTAGASGDDTAATSHNLGDLSAGVIVQAAGTIGDDAAYDPALFSASAPYLFNPASDVDLYHFHVSGTGTYTLASEVFAGRIGSTLDAALSLFRLDHGNPTSPLQLVASNDNSGNQVAASNGNSVPLATDPLLDVSLTAGDYYLAVSSGGQFANIPDSHSNPPGTNGVFDPNVSHSGYNGSSTGAYVLNLQLQPASPTPHVVSTSVPTGGTLGVPPTQLTVTFDRYVNVTLLANLAYAQNAPSPVYFLGHDNEIFYPRLQAYDATTNQATFLVLDRLPNQDYALHLQGLAGHGGVPLAGNDPSGDFVVHFTVNDAATPADPQNRTEQSPQNASGVQDLGVLFPHEVQNAVTVGGSLSAGTAETDTYTFELLEPQDYQLTLTSGQGGPLGNVQMALSDGQGLAVPPLLDSSVGSLHASLQPGRYTLTYTRSSADTTSTAPYKLQITLLNVSENPPPLPLGPAPFLQIRTLNSPPVVAPNPLPSTVIPADSHSTAELAAGALRTELVGGVTGATAESSLALAAPQVQGLSSSTVYASTSLPSLGSTFLGFVFVGATDLPDGASGGVSRSQMDALWASARAWLDSLRPQLESLWQPASPSVAPPLGAALAPAEEALPSGAKVDTPSDTSGSSQVATAVPAQNDEAPASPSDLGPLEESSHQLAGEDGPPSPSSASTWSSLAWIVVPSATVFAVCLLKGRFLQVRKWYKGS